MNATTLAIPFAFVLLAGLICWHIATVKGQWWIKLAFIIVVPSFGLAVWSAIKSYQGYPTDERLPEKGLLLWVDIDEPDESTGDEGAIHVWVIPMSDDADNDALLGYRHARNVPRAYRLAYDRKLHEMFEAAKGRIANGQPIVLERAKKGDQQSGNAQPGEVYSQQEQDLKVYDLPPPALPKKDSQ